MQGVPRVSVELDAGNSAGKLKVMAVSGSHSNLTNTTDRLLDEFLAGCKEAGAEVEKFVLKDMRVKQCDGCFDCLYKTPGTCKFKDDFAKSILPAIKTANILVMATPVYGDGMSSLLKITTERTHIFERPEYEIREGHMRRALPTDVPPNRKLVLIATCVHHSLDNFDPLVLHAKAISKNLCADLVTPLLRPHSMAMVVKPPGLPAVLAAAKQAGREIVSKGEISADTATAVSKELMALKAYVDANNWFVQMNRKRGFVTPASW